VQVLRGAQSLAAFPVSVSASQILAIMPSGAPIGRNSVQVSFQNAKSNPAPVMVAASSFGIFSGNALDLSSPDSFPFTGAAGIGLDPASAQNLAADGSSAGLNSGAQPAVAEQTVTLYGTGLGAIGGSDGDIPDPSSPVVPVQVWVGGQPAQVSASGRSSFPGLDQISFAVPDAAPAGCYVPVQVRTAGAVVSNTATIAISADGSPCSDPANPFSGVLPQGGNAALITLERHDVIDDVHFSPASTFVDDYGSIVVGTPIAASAAFGLLSELPPAGTCSSLARAGQVVGPSYRAVLNAALAGMAISGPSPSASVSNGKRTAPLSVITGVGLAVLGSSNDTTSPLLLDSAGGFAVSGTISGPGDRFQVTAPPPMPFTWTNRQQIGLIDRSRDLTLNWSGGDGTVVVVGGNFDQPTNTSGIFLCTAQASAGSLSVPSYVLSGVPPSRALLHRSAGYLEMTMLPSTLATFNSASLASGLSVSLNWMDKAALFQ
jgi:uncharacterized protein (TIGR03437 family)